MNKAVLPLFAVAVFAIVAASGCVAPEAEAIGELKKDPAASDFLALHPNAQPAVSAWSMQESQERLTELMQKCGPSFFPNDYYYVSYNEGDAVLEAWVYQKTKTVACVYRNDYKCIADSDCTSGTSCLIGECGGIPKVCNATRIWECINGDGCCPEGCIYTTDSDCPEDKCASNADCDDADASTKDTCTGTPKKCVHAKITGCVSGDGYCPLDCSAGTDSDCIKAECETDADCMDNDDLTADSCNFETGLCVHAKETRCIDQDFACPSSCNFRTDTDCAASVGDNERIVVYCGDYSTNIDVDLTQEGDALVASFDAVASHANNKGLAFYDLKGYKYNGLESGSSSGSTGGDIVYNTTIVERIKIQGRAVYDKESKQSFFYFNRDGLQYELQLVDGIPATRTLADTANPFVLDGDDEMAVPLFGKESLITMANQNQGSQEVDLISNFTEYLFTGNGVAANILGKDGETYQFRVSKCGESSIVLNLYRNDAVAASQASVPGNLLFPSLLEKATMLTYVKKNSINGWCDYKYAAGSYFEKIVQGKAFPPIKGKESDWNAMLSFGNNRLKGIILNNEAVVDAEPLETNHDIWIVPEGESVAKGFCRVRFAGLIR